MRPRKRPDWGARKRRALDARAAAMRERYGFVAQRRARALAQPRTADGRRFA